MGSLVAGLATLDNKQVKSAFTERKRQRKTDDSATDDNRVPGLHPNILEEWWYTARGTTKHTKGHKGLASPSGACS